MKHRRFFRASFLVFFSGNRRFSWVFRLLRMAIFGDEGSMAECFVEIDARVFLEGTAHVVSGFSVT